MTPGASDVRGHCSSALRACLSLDDFTATAATQRHEISSHIAASWRFIKETKKGAEIPAGNFRVGRFSVF